MRNPLINVDNAPIREIDTITGGPHIRGKSPKKKETYTGEAKDPPMANYIVNHSQRMRLVEPITFTWEDTVGLHYPRCDALVVRIVIAHNRLRHMLIDNKNLVNILLGSTYDKMTMDHKLTSMTSLLYGFTWDSIIPSEIITLAIKVGTPPLAAYHFMEFLIVDHRFAYHGD